MSDEREPHQDAAAADTLHFEHLVQINDPRELRIEPIRRDQLWRGLLLRAQTPQLFIPWLDEVEVESDADGSLRRVLHFGDYEVRDQVHFENETRVRYEIEDERANTHFSLTMCIEEPANDALFVRFTYAARSIDHHAQSPLGEMVKSAYQQADRDTVFRIRQLAASGVLEKQ
ncbi:SRPBCC family protein [Solimonas marina]|uniref:DUF1857 family protein n=1 Tax=Solimonas marina TaxID=2714601 RepID=A0A970B6N7_9GAMM|nr:SRPBCC family protein [Solimonas marina]NKF24682.1 DUF1857 family protein [Solimonas marina]